MVLTASVDDHERRLDRVLRKALPDLPLSAIYRLLRRGLVLVNGKAAAGDYRVRAGAVITLPGEKTPPAAAPRPPAAPPEILWEGAGLLALNKPAGLSVHGPPPSLEAQVRSYLPPSPSLSFRPGPLHRLDKPSSGVILFAATLEGARYFSGLIRERRVRKRYLALVEGIPEEAVWTDTLIRDRERRKTFSGTGGKPALTRIRPLAVSGGNPKSAGDPAYSLILAEIETGRTHQIRAQGAIRGHPLAGDRKYGGGFRAGGFLLHAWSLTFPLGEASLTITAPIPPSLRGEAARLFGEKGIQALDNPLQEGLC
jgi:23S rRNA pseudouridine955/2504/2580 synthase